MSFEECKAFLKGLFLGKTKPLNFMPFFTNGGNWGWAYNVSLIAKDSGVYSIANGFSHNVIVKSIYVDNTKTFKKMCMKWYKMCED